MSSKNFKGVLEKLQESYLKASGDASPPKKEVEKEKTKKVSFFDRLKHDFEGKKEGEKKETKKESIFDRLKDDLEGKKEGEKEETKKKSIFDRLKDDLEGKKKGTKKKYSETKEKLSGKFKKFYEYLRKGNAAFFIYFSFVCIIIFTFTLISVYNNSDIYNDNISMMKNTQGFYTFGIVILSIFLIALSWSFGEDKEIIKKIMSFILIAGCIYMGTFFTYLEGEGRYQDLSSAESMVSVLAVILFVIFLLASAAYVLFEEKGGGHKKVWEFFSTLYLLASFIGFFVLGGATANAFANIKIPGGEKESLLLPLCIGLFAGGCVLFGLGLLDSIAPVRKAINGAMKGVLTIFRKPRFAFIVFMSFVMSIYYTITFYESYTSLYIQEKIEEKKSNKLISLLQTLYYAGFGILALFLLILAMSFGGDAQQIIVSLFLVSYIFFVGSFLTYLETENKIHVSEDEQGMVTGTIVVFCILIVVALLYVLFVNKRTKQVLILDVLQLGTIIGSIVLFEVMFGVCTGVAFQDYMSKEGSTTEGVLLWSGFGIGLFINLVILGLIISFFFAP